MDLLYKYRAIPQQKKIWLYFIKIEPYFKPGVYEIPIKNNHGRVIASYIGSSKHSILRRMFQHFADLKHSRRTTALANYCLENEAYPSFEDLKLLCHQSDEFKIRYAEDIHIWNCGQ